MPPLQSYSLGLISCLSSTSTLSLVELDLSANFFKLLELVLCLGEADLDNGFGEELLGGNGNKVSSLVMVVTLGEGLGDILSISI